MKIRAESNTTPVFAQASKIGFSTDTVNDQAIKGTLGKLSMLAAAGRLLVIPASASVLELANAVPVMVPVTDAEKKAAAKLIAKTREAGNIPYHVIATYTRVFESGNGEGRAGKQTAEIAGFGDTDSLIP